MSGGDSVEFKVKEGNFMDQLPEALLVEILIRLPCKACFRCKAVSKLWFSIISQPFFVREFIRLRKKKTITGTVGQRQPSLALLKQNNYADRAEYSTTCSEKADEFPFTLVCPFGGVLITDGIFKSSGFSLDFLPDCQPGVAGRLNVVGSSQDLLLCSSTRVYQKDYYVCNPLTKQWLQVPQPPNVHFRVVIGFYSEPFIPFKQGADLNFTFNYTVIRLKRRQINATIEIFSSEKGEWRESSVTITHVPFLSWAVLDRLTPAIANCGSVHWWWMCCGRFAVYDPLQNCIRLIQHPHDALPIYSWVSDLGSCRGSIRIYHLLMDPDDENHTTHFDIWESIAGEEWRLVRKVCIRELRADDTGLRREIRPACPALEHIFIHPDDGDLVFLVFRRSIGVCNLRAMTLTPLGKFMSGLLSDRLVPLRLQHWPTPLSQIS